MKIEMNISTTICGENSKEQNLRFAAAVREAVSNEYEGATVSVELTSGVGGVNVTDTESYNCMDTWDIYERVGEIANDVWEAATY